MKQAILIVAALVALAVAPTTQAFQYDADKIDVNELGLARVCAVGTTLVCVDVLPGGECWTAASDGVVYTSDRGIACHPNNSAFNFCTMERGLGCYRLLMSYNGATCVIGVGLSYSSAIPLACVSTAAIEDLLSTTQSDSKAELVDVNEIGVARVCAVGTTLVCVDVLPGGTCWTAASDGVVYTSDRGIACHPGGATTFCTMETGLGCYRLLMPFNGATCVIGVGLSYSSLIPLACVDIGAITRAIS